MRQLAPLVRHPGLRFAPATLSYAEPPLLFVTPPSAHTATREQVLWWLPVLRRAARGWQHAKAAFHAQRRCRIGFCSGTLSLVKHRASLLSFQQPPAGAVLVAARGPGGPAVQPKAKVSRSRFPRVSPGRERKGGVSKTAPNPSIEGMPKRLRLSVTPHVKR